MTAMLLLADEYVPFVYPLPIWDYWPWLMLPLCLHFRRMAQNFK